MGDKQKRLADYARVAVRLERETGAPAAFLVAQWAVESAWGEKQSGDFNFWGITYNPNLHKDFKWCPTREVLTQRQIDALDPEEKREMRVTSVLPSGKSEIRLRRRFSSFATEAEARASYVRLIQGKTRYGKAIAEYTRQPEKNTAALAAFIDAIAASGYATDPGYAKLLKAVATQPDVTLALAQARAEV